MNSRIKNIILKKSILTLDGSFFYNYFSNRILPDYESNPNKIIYANLSGYSVSKGISFNIDFMRQNGLSLQVGATLMDASIIEKQIKTWQ